MEAIVRKHPAIWIPEGLHGGEEIFGAVCRSLGFTLHSYPLSTLKQRETAPLRIREFIEPDRVALFVLPTTVRIDRELVHHADGRIFAFGSVSTGSDHVDFDALDDANLQFIHAPGANSRSVVEYLLSTFPLFFSQERLAARALKVGIIGYGRIGSLLGRYLERLGIPHVWYDPYVSPDSRFAPVEEVPGCDVVTFHVPLTKTGSDPTHRMVTEAYLKSLRNGALLVNTARGEIFTEEGFSHACATAATVMDVFPQEPPPPWMVEHSSIVSPHIAGYSYSGRGGGTRLLAENFVRLIGADPSIVPMYTAPLYEIDSVDFLEAESALLKRDPESFRLRRENYPNRSDFSDLIGTEKFETLDPFRRRLVEIDASFQEKRN